MEIRVGVDNYSYHRLLGEVRAGESASDVESWDWEESIRSSRRSGADVIALETCFISSPSQVVRYSTDVDPMVMLSWGHPFGLEYGTSTEAEFDLLAWMDVAAELICRRMRIVVGHPAIHAGLWSADNASKTVEALKRVTRRSGELGLELAIENHADLRARELRDLVCTVESPNLGVCLDLANVVRVGDDPVEATHILAPHVRVVHVKDVDLSRPYGLAGPPSLPLGTGSLPVREILDVITTMHRDVWLLVEVAQIEGPDVREEEWITRDIAWIRGQL